MFESFAGSFFMPYYYLNKTLEKDIIYILNYYGDLFACFRKKLDGTRFFEFLYKEILYWNTPFECCVYVIINDRGYWKPKASLIDCL